MSFNLGAYNDFLVASYLGEEPLELSYRRSCFQNLAEWQARARAKVLEFIAIPDLAVDTRTKTLASTEVSGVAVERIQYQLPFGPPTEAVLLKPAAAAGPLPGVIALHCHAGAKYFGWRKLVEDGRPIHPIIEEIRREEYEAVAWANELAKRGYLVLCHDVFSFGSRRIRVSDVPAKIRWVNVREVTEEEVSEDIQRYNAWADQHEHIVAKSLISSGLCWPSLVTFDDQAAVSVLAARPEVDPNRLGCCGLSGGGIRAVYLGGLDLRVKVAVSVGGMTTWRDLATRKGGNHTWMMWTPVLSRYLDYPEILGLRVPLPTMVQNDIDDNLWTLEEMRRADDILREVYEKAGASEYYEGRFYPGPHKFDMAMQADAFAFLDRWLQ